ncbi:MAG: MBL fold metallo-hydrolase [Dehalococcoidales bacterium]|nr:MBL fold metallo-hydrolase [Dehalococcoidales bacterium]
MKLGALELVFVPDGHFRLDGGMLFGVVPRVLWQKRASPDTENRVALEMNCLLIKGPDGHNIIVDTGLGTHLSEKERGQVWGLEEGPRLLDGLRALGLAPEDIDLVVNSHLHLDHSGGNTTIRDGRIVPTFPRARYLVQRREWEDACHVNERTRASYFPQYLAPLAEAGVLELLDGETQLTPYLRVMPSPGHTAGHQSVLIGEGDDKALYLGDVAPFTVHFERLAWIPAIDVFPLTTLETKRSLVTEALHNDHRLIFYHDPQTTAGRLSHVEDGKYRVSPLSSPS